MKRKCICEICTCGRHRCPHNPAQIFEKSENPCVVTEYVANYPKHNHIQPLQSMKPKQEYQGNRGKMEGITTFRSDYVPHDIVNRRGRAHEEYQAKPGDIDHWTTYTRDFNSYKIQPVAPMRPMENRQMNTGKFDGNPTYRDDFKPWDIQKRELAKQEKGYQPPKEKFGNATTFQDDYFSKGVMPRKSFKPPGVAKRSDIPFDAITNHRISYVQYELEPKFARQKKEYKPNSHPFDGLTTHSLSYKGALGEITRSFKPEHVKVGSNARFEGNTEFKDSFQPWSLPSHYVHKAEEYIPPKTPMEKDTTTSRDYVPHQLSFVAPIRPVYHGRRRNVPFEANSTMKEDFRAWQTRRPEIIKKDNQFPKVSGKFDGLTTFKSHYLPHEMNPTQSYKPSNKALRSSAPFESGTMYRSDFTSKKKEICPAVYESPPGFIFEKVDSRGHKMFRKILTSERN
ncbi:stabilizer of axonemal microtubules 2-like [Pelodytes ibericus]